MCSKLLEETQNGRAGYWPWARPQIRRAGNAFVHRPDRLSASAYSCSGGFVLPAPRARRRQESTQGDLSDQGVARRNFVQFAHVPTEVLRTRIGPRRRWVEIRV